MNMVSAASVCIFGVLFVAMMTTICVAQPPRGHRNNWKCMPNEEDMKAKRVLGEKCYEKETGKTMPPQEQRGPGSQEERPSKAEFEAVMLCVAIESELIKDGKFNAEQSKAEVDRMEADDDTKEALKAAIDDCNDQDGDAESKFKCSQQSFFRLCKGE